MMKRFFSLILAIAMVLTAMAQSSGIVLSYNKGKELRFFKADQLSLAMDEAENNDTIYFGPGRYGIGSKITKPLTFIGTGCHSNGTYLYPLTSSSDYSSEPLYLEIDPRLEEDKKVISFEGMSFAPYNTNNSIYIRPCSNLKLLKLVSTSISTLFDNKDFVIDNLIIDKCILSFLELSNFTTKHCTVNNTIIRINNGYYNVKGGCDSKFGVATFDHCFLEKLDDDFVGIVKHSIIHTSDAGSDALLENCLYYRTYGTPETECTWINSENIYQYETEYETQKCNDGTLYGTRGGSSPRTPYPPYPTADTSADSTGKAKSFLDYDALNKKLSITVKMLGK